MKCKVEYDVEKAKKWLKENKNTPIGDTPLWVLISLGVMVLTEEDEECQRMKEKQ